MVKKHHTTRHYGGQRNPAAPVMRSKWTHEVGKGVEFTAGLQARVIVTVKTYCKPLRKVWSEACYRLGVQFESVHGKDENGNNIGIGEPDENGHYQCQSYDCVGDATAIARLMVWEYPGVDSRFAGPIVEWHYAVAARIGVQGQGSGPKKIKAGNKPGKRGKWHGASPDEYDRTSRADSETACIRAAVEADCIVS